MARHPDQNYFGAARDFSDTEFAKFARSVSAHTPSRCLLESESIFAARDHDPLRPWYSVPGTPFRVHFGTAAGHGFDRVSRNGAHDSDVTRLVLTRFRGRPVNASTLVEIGDALIAWWRAEQADAMSRAVFGEELVPKPAAQNAGLTLIAALERIGWHPVGPFERNILRDAWCAYAQSARETEPRHITIERRAVKRAQNVGHPFPIWDEVECALCGQAWGTSRDICVAVLEAKEPEARAEQRRCHEACAKLATDPAFWSGLSAIERVRAPAWEMAIERVAEQVRAGGVDCDVTRRAAHRQVRVEAAMAELVCEHTRLVHDPKLRWYGMAPKDLLAVARAAVQADLAHKAALVLPPGWNHCRCLPVAATVAEQVQVNFEITVES
ncbi:MAG: hypothetical protein AMXMBFR56_66090 [Polyangiaceae bacterium]